ncbi:MAG: UvrD-helicase domain-containing protein [Alphaproteobacteria bacterium]|nr:UvrD-helicase domain-containing protein [Rickettsiales bacterium]
MENSLNDRSKNLPHNLNNKQLKAVETNNSNMLILAGAGTGKTKTVVAKISYLINNNLATSDQIMGLTFTNKASKEMKNRLFSVCNIDNIWLGTFHSVCVRMLRMFADQAGLDKNFIIADQSESYQVIKNVIKNEFPQANLTVAYKAVASAISQLKEKGITYDSDLVPKTKIYDVQIDKAYASYQKKLKRSNLLDFDDIIVITTKLMQNNPSVATEVHNKFKYLFVDEYQDTSTGQNALIKSFCGTDAIVCCVGDEDQSIYSWRGANIGNILTFDKSFSPAKIVTLEINYRSTNNIVSFASSLIKQNKNRYDKRIESFIGIGSKVKITQLHNDSAEANNVAQEIRKIKQANGVLNNVAILVRASYQNKSFEEAFNNYGISYRIVDGVKFFERKEVKDLIAYLRFAFSNKDEISFERVVNTPKRGIGDKTVKNILSGCVDSGNSPLQVLKKMLLNKELRESQANKLEEFVKQIEAWSKEIELNNSPVSKIVEEMAHQSGYIQGLKDVRETDPTADDRIRNIYSLICDLKEFDSVSAFLEYITLVSQRDTDSDGDAVNIMTIHGAKGLEFEHVFCVGWEEGVFPSCKYAECNLENAIEEERRLGYVAITRAKNNLFISYAKSRLTFGSRKENPPSRFITELRNNASPDSFESIYPQGEDSYEVKNKFGSSVFKNTNSFKQKAYNKYGDTYATNKLPNFNYNNKTEDTFSFTTSRTSSQSDNNTMLLKADSKITHTTFGEGKVVKTLGNYAEVIFKNSEGRKLIHCNFIKIVK